MKTLCFIIFTVLLVIAQAEDSQKAIKGLERKSPKVQRGARAYHEAKEECLKKEVDLKGSRLTNCIVDYQKKAK